MSANINAVAYRDPLDSDVSDRIPASIPMSFPAALRSSKLTDRFAHLRIASASSEIASSVGLQPKEKVREDREGKRWVRRKENARFSGNPHIVAASKGDYSPILPTVKATFPEPLPPYLPRNLSVSSISSPPVPDQNSSNAGRFSLSLKGMRKELRKSGSRAQHLVRDVESEIVAWLREGGVLLYPDDKETTYGLSDTPIGGSGSIHEVARTPLRLVWSITDDAFARYIVHCCARYHEVVSYSKHVDGRRLTYLLRPNVTRPDHTAAALLDTPPPTDLDYSSQGDLESESDLISDREILEPSISETLERPQSALSSISETSPSTIAHDHRHHNHHTYRAASTGEQSDDEWSVVLGGDLEPDASELPANESMDSLADSSVHCSAAEQYMQRGVDVDQTPTRTNQSSRGLYTRHSIRQSPLSRVWERRNRASSSPSRSPARRSFRRAVTRVHRPITEVPNSFYDYLFSD